jgi:hypothetical protein
VLKFQLPSTSQRGDNIFAEVIKLVIGDLYSNLTVILREKEMWTSSPHQAQGEHHVEMKAEIRMMQIQNQGTQRFPANLQMLGERHEQSSRHNLQKEEA